ncbi:hypothetical protein CBOM_05772 [Ceraceosorus bombacis]|uniref:Uncharacterized protein n=1 Tax=Ceraceosorus bombacis TaxID=401625 RepID=A0A0P1BSQ3_9BASI|nr:hypothetical protein CBOM_05772 [Ceraceosorus bombacis]
MQVSSVTFALAVLAGLAAAFPVTLPNNGPEISSQKNSLQARDPRPQGLPAAKYDPMYKNKGGETFKVMTPGPEKYNQEPFKMPKEQKHNGSGHPSETNHDKGHGSGFVPQKFDNEPEKKNGGHTPKSFGPGRQSFGEQPHKKQSETFNWGMGIGPERFDTEPGRTKTMGSGSPYNPKGAWNGLPNGHTGGRGDKPVVSGAKTPLFEQSFIPMGRTGGGTYHLDRRSEPGVNDGAGSLEARAHTPGKESEESDAEKKVKKHKHKHEHHSQVQGSGVGPTNSGTGFVNPFANHPATAEEKGRVERSAMHEASRFGGVGLAPGTIHLDRRSKQGVKLDAETLEARDGGTATASPTTAESGFGKRSPQPQEGIWQAEMLQARQTTWEQAEQNLRDTQKLLKENKEYLEKMRAAKSGPRHRREIEERASTIEARHAASRDSQASLRRRDDCGFPNQYSEACQQQRQAEKLQRAKEQHRQQQKLAGIPKTSKTSPGHAKEGPIGTRDIVQPVQQIDRRWKSFEELQKGHRSFKEIYDPNQSKSAVPAAAAPAGGPQHRRDIQELSHGSAAQIIESRNQQLEDFANQWQKTVDALKSYHIGRKRDVEVSSG